MSAALISSMVMAFMPRRKLDRLISPRCGLPKHFTLLFCLTSILLMQVARAQNAQSPSPPEASFQQGNTVRSLLAPQAPNDTRISSSLLLAMQPADAFRSATLRNLRVVPPKDDAGRVLVDIDITEDLSPRLSQEIENRGGTIAFQSTHYHTIRAWLPLDAVRPRRISTT
jgi:hypothetical protein